MVSEAGIFFGNLNDGIFATKIVAQHFLRSRELPVDVRGKHNDNVATKLNSRNTSGVKTNIVRIGNERVIRLPKSILAQCGLKDKVELVVEDNVLIVRPIHAPRSGWSDAFSEMALRKDDKRLDADTGLATEWDESEWRW